jgi:hypothetical protein
MDRVVEREFKKYEREGISRKLLETSWKNCERIAEFKRYKIIGRQVYGPETRVKKFLEVLAQKYPVPDVDFIYFYEDRLKKSFFKRSKHAKTAPLFVSAKERGIDSAILFVDWVYDPTDFKGGWNFLIETVHPIDWSQKKEKLFWRGMPWDGKHFGMYNFDNWRTIPRGTLVSLSRKYPHLIDALFSQYPDKCASDPERCLREMGKIEFVDWPEVLSYKYQAALDGVTCSFPATQWKLLSGSVVFKQDSENIQFFYDEMIPWKHYIPVKNDLSDVLEKIKWAKEHDEEARKIGERGREFALTHCMPEHIFLYCYKVLVKYASLLN